MRTRESNLRLRWSSRGPWPPVCPSASTRTAAEAAGYAPEGATVVTVGVDTVCLAGTTAHHLAVVRNRWS
jgi:hypothetical protein